ncbi:MAG: hypothetical protein HPKKFMNG_02464 [Planctomycetes bacterium]|nr:hypothetical protein [Planctomycetota bacterium]GIK51677.1 MAG: hypothetical protein BroJett014_06500 [Planctomycetota bacterium]HRJ79724.1 hypothetical protein [Planctomycetota bacterium]
MLRLLCLLILWFVAAHGTPCGAATIETPDPTVPRDVAPIVVPAWKSFEIPDNGVFVRWHGVTDDDCARLAGIRTLRYLDLSSSPLLSDRGLSRLAALQLEGLNLSNTAVGAEGLESLRTMSSLRHLNVSGRLKWSGRAVLALCKLERLTSLHITWDWLTSEQAALLVALPALEHLSLWTVCELSGPLASALQDAKQLRLLDLSGCRQIRSEVFDALAHCHKLEHLSLTNCVGPGDDVAGRLAALPRLRVLSLAGFESLSATGIDAIGRLTSLEELDVGVSGGTDEARSLNLGSLKNLKRLKLLSMSGRIFTSGSPASIFTQFRDLRILSLSHCKPVTDEVLKAVSVLRSLERLHLAQCGEVTDEGVSSLSACKALNALTLRDCPRIGDAAIVPLCRACPLRVLSLSGCVGVTDRGLEAIAKCRGLTNLGLDGLASVTGKALRALHELTDLTGLSLAGTALDDAGLQLLGKLPKLKTLILSGCLKVTDEGLVGLSNCATLRHLQLDGCRALSDEARKWLKTKLPHCHISD